MEIAKENFEAIQNLDNVVMKSELQKITGDVITRMFFGKDFSKLKIDGLHITLAMAKLLSDIAI